MSWLFSRQVRPFVLLAAAASVVRTVAWLVPAVYRVQVSAGVWASRSLETLVMLTALALLALALGYCMDSVRARALAWAGEALDRRLAPSALAALLAQAAASGGRVDNDALRDIAQLRRFVGGSGIQALFDAPWLPVYLLVIAFMHPALGGIAAVGACLLAALAVLTERLTRREAEAALQRSRAASRHAESLARNAEVIIGMGMTAAAVAGWQSRQDALLAAQARLGARSARLAAAARVLRQGLQLGMLGVGAWLVVDAGASPGIMVAATILLGRALQPVEQLISGWKQLVDARGAWRRLSEREPALAAESELSFPAPVGRIELERVVFTHDPARPALIKGLSLTIDAGDSVGIVGVSGSGKTTLMRLLLGIWHVHSGAVRVDGTNIAHWTRSDLGAHLGYLPQDVS